MKPVDQQVPHDPENGKYGDCQRACIASLLNKPSEDVPHFLEDGNNSEFWRKINQYLDSQGLFHLEVIGNPFDTSMGMEIGRCYHMIYGRTERGTQHAVVGLNGKIVHDPHPSRAGLLESEKDNWTYAFLVHTGVD